MEVPRHARPIRPGKIQGRFVVGIACSLAADKVYNVVLLTYDLFPLILSLFSSLSLLSLFSSLLFSLLPPLVRL